MKKVRYLFLLVLAVVCCAVCVNASGGAVLSGADSVTAGDTVELILSVSDCPDTTSVSVAVSYGSDLELVSAQWLQKGAITYFDTNANKGVVGGLDSPDINGDLFKLVLRAKTPSAEVQTVSVTVGAKNGSQDVMKETAVKNISVSCAVHSFGAWNTDASEHRRTCTVCGTEVKGLHTWDAGTITSDPTCTHQGTAVYTCTQCGDSKTQPLPVVEHDYADGVCQWCNGEDPNYVPPVPGNLNDDDVVDNQDVELLLWYTLFPEEYTIPVSADFNHDGTTNNEDVEYLLWHTLFPDDYPIE